MSAKSARVPLYDHELQTKGFGPFLFFKILIFAHFSLILALEHIGESGYNYTIKNAKRRVMT